MLDRKLALLYKSIQKDITKLDNRMIQLYFKNRSSYTFPEWMWRYLYANRNNVTAWAGPVGSGNWVAVMDVILSKKDTFLIGGLKKSNGTSRVYGETTTDMKTVIEFVSFFNENYDETRMDRLAETINSVNKDGVSVKEILTKEFNFKFNQEEVNQAIAWADILY